MSIKIYQGWRVKLERFAEATKAIRNAQLDELYNLALLFLNPGNQRLPMSEDRELKALDRLTKLLKTLQCGFEFWITSEYVYIIPYGKSVNTPLPEYIEEFHYQNQVDEWESGRELSQEEIEDYHLRGEVWNSVGYGNPELTYKHEFLSEDNLFCVSRDIVLRYQSECTVNR